MKTALNVVTAFATWASVLAVGVMVSWALFRIFVVCGLTAYRLMRP